MNSVAMGFAFFSPDEARFLDGFGKRAEGSRGFVSPSDLDEVSLGVSRNDRTGGSTVVGYALGNDVSTPAEAVARTADLTPIEEGLLRKMAPSEILFHWEDDLLAPADRGPSVPVYAAVVLEEETAARLKSLIAEMLVDHKAGLIERARSVGYYRECMALSRDPEGRPVYLLYLELKVADYPTMVSRLLEYPKTPFNIWWTPQYIELVGRELVKAAGSSIAYRWTHPS